MFKAAAPGETGDARRGAAGWLEAGAGWLEAAGAAGWVAPAPPWGEAGVETAPAATSCRTTASTIWLILASSIVLSSLSFVFAAARQHRKRTRYYLLRKNVGSPAFSVSTPSFIRPRSTIHFSNSAA